MKKLHILIILFFCLHGLNYGQTIERQVIATAGDHFKINGAELSWTLGEVAIENYSNISSALSQGFQQNGKKFGSLSKSLNEFVTEERIDTLVVGPESFLIKVYPNPTDHFINVDLSSAWQVGCYLEIIDIFGRSVLVVNLTEAETRKIDISALNSGIYILQLKNNLNTIKSYKINKIN